MVSECCGGRRSGRGGVRTRQAASSAGVRARPRSRGAARRLRGALARAAPARKKCVPMDTENPKRRKTFATRGVGGAERAVTREKPTDASRSFAASANRINSASCGLRRASPRARSRRRPGRNSARDREKRVGLEPRGAPEPAPVASRETRKAPGRGEAHEEARGRWVARRTLPTRSCDARCRKGSRGRDGGPTEGFIIRHAKSEKPKTIRNRHVLPRQFRFSSAAQPPAHFLSRSTPSLYAFCVTDGYTYVDYLLNSLY